MLHHITKLKNHFFGRIPNKQQKIAYFNEKKLLLSNKQNFLFSNWYILLILAFCCFILFLKYQDTKKEKEKFKEIEKPIEKLSNSESYESVYYVKKLKD